MIILLIILLISILIISIITIRLFKYNKIMDNTAIELFYDYINYKNYLINNISKYNQNVDINILNNYSIDKLEELFVNLKKEIEK